MRESTGNVGRRKSQSLLPFEVNSSIPKLLVDTPAHSDPENCDAIVLCSLPQTMLITIFHPDSQFNLIQMFFLDFLYLSNTLLSTNSAFIAFQLKTSSYLLCRLQQSWQFNK